VCATFRHRLHPDLLRDAVSTLGRRPKSLPEPTLAAIDPKGGGNPRTFDSEQFFDQIENVNARTTGRGPPGIPAGKDRPQNRTKPMNGRVEFRVFRAGRRNTVCAIGRSRSQWRRPSPSIQMRCSLFPRTENLRVDRDLEATESPSGFWNQAQVRAVFSAQEGGPVDGFTWRIPNCQLPAKRQEFRAGRARFEVR